MTRSPDDGEAPDGDEIREAFTSPPTRVGHGADLPVVDANRYRIEGEIARGGSSRIVRARDLRLGRTVALKLPPGGATHLQRRFEREALLTARLQHPSIVSVHEAGRLPGGEPFFVMSLVAGRPFDGVIDGTTTLRERLALLPVVQGVADALACAHGQRVVHRDLRPHNVLVGALGEAVIVDWSMAKALDAREDPDDPARRGAPRAADPARTEGGTADAVGLTAAYMPPEQAAGRPVTARADVYAIGAMLYHLLAGEPPYGAGTPGEILGRVLAGPPPPLAQRAPGVAPELATLVTKAMQPDPARRHPSAREMADELRRYTTERIAGGQRYTVRHRAAAWLRRHRQALVVATATLALLVVVGALAVRGAVRERARAERERAAAAERVEALLLSEARAALARDPMRALAWLARLPLGSRHWPAARLVALEARTLGIARVLSGLGGPVRKTAFSPDGKLVAVAAHGAAVTLWDAATGASRELAGHAGAVEDLAFSPDGRRLASAGADRTVRLWDVATGAARALAHPAPVTEVAFTPDGAWLVTLAQDRTARVWDAAGAAPPRVVARADEALSGLTVSPRGDRIAARVGERRPGVWALVEGAGRVPALPVADGATLPVFSPDGGSLAFGARDRLVRVVDLASGRARVLRGHEQDVTAVAYARGGALAAAGADGSVRLWGPGGAGEPRALLGHDGAVDGVAFSPDGARLASWGADLTVRVWDLGAGERRVLRGHGERVTSVAFAPDGRALVSGGADGAARLVDLVGKEERVFTVPRGTLTRLAVSPDGRTVATAGSDRALRLWDVTSGASRVFEGHDGDVTDLVFSPDGRTLASASLDRTVRVWDVDTGRAALLRGHDGPVVSLAYSPDGAWVASGSADRTVRLWATATGQGRVLAGHQGAVAAVAFAPDGRSVASASADRTVKLWDVVTGMPRTLKTAAAVGGGADDEQAARLAFAPDGGQLAAACGDFSVRLWDVGGADAPRAILRGHEAALTGLVFAPDGRRLATGSLDGSVRLWDVGAGTAAVLRGSGARVAGVRFSTDGSRLVTAGDDGALGVWDVASRQGGALHGHAGRVVGAAYLRDGRTLVSAGGAVLRVWLDDVPADPGALRAWIETARHGLSDAGLDALRLP